jgi:flavin reductase (DIM6/NTAB) family NADH-FMN oxidoreductase RutF
MILDPQSLTPGALYRFMISAVVPRPIALISTAAADGSLNLAPFSYFNAITNRPPLLGVSINSRGGEPKDTLRNIRAIGEYVVNIVTESMAERMVLASGDWPAETDEFQITGFTPAPSALVRPPRVAESPVNLECRLHREIPFGDATFVVGELVRAHVADELMVEGVVDIARLMPLGRLGGDGYAFVRDVIHLPRPKVKRDPR